MSEFLPQALQDELDLARKSQDRKRARMKVHAGGREFVILRYWDNGFALDAEDAPKLRGLVDIYNGPNHLCQALVVTSSETDGVRLFEVKRSTPAVQRAPAADYLRERPDPVGLLPSS